MKYTKIMKLGMAAIISVFLVLLINSFIGNTNTQALAKQPDHFYTPHDGIFKQTPERLTLPLQSQN